MIEKSITFQSILPILTDTSLMPQENPIFSQKFSGLPLLPDVNPSYAVYVDDPPRIPRELRPNNIRRRSSNHTPRVANGDKIRYINSYCTKRNCVICTVLFGLVIIAFLALNIWLSLVNDEYERPIPLQLESRSLARFYTPEWVLIILHM